MLTIWQEVLLLKVQAQLSELFKPLNTFQLPSPLHGSFPKSQSFFPSFLPISFNTFTAHLIENPRTNNGLESILMNQYMFVC